MNNNKNNKLTCLIFIILNILFIIMSITYAQDYDDDEGITLEELEEEAGITLEDLEAEAGYSATTATTTTTIPVDWD